MTISPHSEARKIILHCGSSKNGSTTIQSTLLAESVFLHLHATTALSLVSSPLFKFEDELSVDDCMLVFEKEVGSSNGIAKEQTASLANLYEIYKALRERRDLAGLQSLERTILGAVFSALERFSTVILSAEAFETSLCLRDPFFKRLVLKLARMGEVLLVFYQADSSKHAIGSWLQWGWIEKYRYSDWLRLYLQKTTCRRFFARRAQPYWGNLVDVKEWLGYWPSEGTVSLQLFAGISDTCKHFFSEVLAMDIDGFRRLSSTQRNIGWPKSLISAYPLFYDFIAGEYVKYEVLRQLLIDKENEGGSKEMENYQRLLMLSHLALLNFDYRSASGTNEIVLSRDEIELIFQQIDEYFKNVSAEEVAKVYRYLADAMYFLHNKV